MERIETRRTGTDEVPVGIIWGEFLERAGLDEVDPCWDLELS